MDTSEWRDIPTYPGYQVTVDGRIRRKESTYKFRQKTCIRKGFEMRTYINTYGYPICEMVGKTRFVHKLIALAFIPKPEGKTQVNHKNGIKTDNRIENLEWVTAKENCAHRCRVLGKGQGESNGWSRFTEEDVKQMRLLSFEGLNSAQIGRMFRTARQTIRHILLRKSWSHVP